MDRMMVSELGVCCSAVVDVEVGGDGDGFKMGL